MKKDKLAMRVEVETILENKPMSEVNFSIRMQKFVLFLYKESTIFWTFFPIFMGSFIYFLCTEGPTNHTMSLGVIEAVLYLAFYHGFIKKIKPFKNRAEEYNEIKDRLDVLIDYRDYRLAQ
jgi:hypothetical protein